MVSLKSKRSLPQKSRIVKQRETEEMLPSSGPWKYSRLRVPQKLTPLPIVIACRHHVF